MLVSLQFAVEFKDFFEALLGLERGFHPFETHTLQKHQQAKVVVFILGVRIWKKGQFNMISIVNQKYTDGLVKKLYIIGFTTHMALIHVVCFKSYC